MVKALLKNFIFHTLFLCFQYLESSFGLLFQLLKEVEECETKVSEDTDDFKSLYMIWNIIF